MRLVMVHLAVEEFDAAEFYANKVRALREPETRGIGQPLLALIGHRRARAAHEQGRTVDSFAADTQARLALLVDGEKDSPAARVVNRVVASEIYGTLGDLTRAREELESAQVDGQIPRAVLELYFTRADALYRMLDLREPLVEVARRLSRLEGLSEDARLDYARAAVRAMVRGLSYQEADARLSRELTEVEQGEELAFALELGRLVLAIRGGRDPELRARLIALYERETRVDRRRTIVLDALARAANVGADGIIEAVAERYLDDVPVGTAERRRAERLYRRAILGRAYRRLARERFDEAFADFAEVYRRIGSLEALVGALDLRLREGKASSLIEAEFTEGREPALQNFVRAYLMAQELPRLSTLDALRAQKDAVGLMRAAMSKLRGEAPARALLGGLMLHEYLRTKSPAAAESANVHLLVALEQSRYEPRQQGKVLTQLGLLHGHAGNFRIALSYLEQRTSLPLKRDAEALTVLLAKAQALLHVERQGEAAETADAALALVDETAALAPYLPLALDRAALANFAGGRFARALALYDRELPLLSDGRDRETLRNRFVVRLARAASALGAGEARRAVEDLTALEPQLSDAQVVAALAQGHRDGTETAQSYRRMLQGLLARGHRMLGQLEAAREALEVQRALLSARLQAGHRSEELRALMLVEARLAQNAAERGEREHAARWLTSAFERGERLMEVGGTQVDRDYLRLVWLAAELARAQALPSSFDAVARLRDAQDRLISVRSPEFDPYRFWFALYLAL